MLWKTKPAGAAEGDTARHDLEREAAPSRLRTLLFTGLAVGALAWLALRLWGEGTGMAAVWPAGGVLAGMMLRHVGMQAWWLLAVGFVALVLAGLGLNSAPLAAVAFAAVQAVEACVAWLGVRAWSVAPGEPPEPRGVFVAALALLGLAPGAGAVLAGLAAVGLGTGGFLEMLPRWWMAHAAGLALLVPVFWSYRADVAEDWRAEGRAPEFWLALALTAGLVYAAPAWTAWPYAALSLPLLLAAWRLGMFGTALLGALGYAMVCGAAWLRGDAAGLPQAGLALALVALAPWLAAVAIAGKARAQRLARHAQEHLRHVVEHAPVLIAEFDRGLRHRAVNPQYRSFHGRPPDALLDSTLRQVYGEPLGSRLAGRAERALLGQVQRFTAALPDGRELEWTYVPEHDAEGAVEGFVAIAQDVSWRNAGNERVLALFESTPEALCVVADDGTLAAVNDRFASLFGYAGATLPGQPLTLLLPGAERDAVEAAAAQEPPVLREAAVGPLQGRHFDGHHFSAELLVGPRQEALGAGRLCAVRTVVARAAEMRGTPEDMQQDRDRARVILDAIGDAVVACDTEQRITLFNPVAETMTGWRGDEALGRPLEEVVRVVEIKGEERALSPIRMAFDSRGPLTLRSETALVRRDGERTRVEVSVAPIMDGQGALTGGVMVLRDVSHAHTMALEMAHMAQHDHLTQLPNRVLLHDRLSQELAKTREGRKGALLFLDLDFFKHINDTLGHAVGDKVLQEVARRLVESVREDDTVSRQGGDEFVLLLVRLADPRDAARVAEKLIQAVERPIPHEGQDLHVSASIGIALFPQDARDVKTLMMQADTALYHAKQAGRGRYSYFTAQMSEKAEARMRMEHDLRFALAHEDFFLLYQPKVRLRDGAVTGMEALVRWRTSDGVLVPPAEFIPVAEETGLIVPMDEWVMQEACRRNKAWQDAGLPAVPVSVNVSLARFDADRLLASVRRALDGSGLPPQCLEIEFTESQMFGHLERAQQLIADLKGMGVRVAVDDFGVGYSSLNYLVQYPFDTLKIDRSFVAGLPDEARHSAIVQAILVMAHTLGHHVVAEGVETIAQAEALARHGCDEAQGYLYSRPLSAEDFAAVLRRGQIRLPELHDALPGD